MLGKVKRILNNTDVKLYVCRRGSLRTGHLQVRRLQGDPQAQRRTPRKGLSDHRWTDQLKLFHGKVLLRQNGKGGLIMAVDKEEKANTWRALYRYTNWNDERKQTKNWGFKIQ